MLTCIYYLQAGSGSQSTSQSLDSGTNPQIPGQDHVKIPTTVIIPVAIIAVALLVPLWLCLRRMQGAGRITPVYRQEHVVEKPKLCEVALMNSSYGEKVLPHPWRRLRVSAAHRELSRN